MTAISVTQQHRHIEESIVNNQTYIFNSDNDKFNICNFIGLSRHSLDLNTISINSDVYINTFGLSLVNVLFASKSNESLLNYKHFLNVG